jgi:hypothetical protein
MRPAWRLGWALWIVAFIALPVPYGGLEHGWVPAFWLAAMAALAGVVALLEGGAIPVQIAAVFALQAALASVALAALVVVVSGLAARVAGAAWTRRLCALAAVALLLLTLCPVYRSPISRTAGWTSLGGLWR